ncbi:MAG: gluconate 2-dehydrogenase subunit 3 family protein [Gammaproteobacteria bacterium]|nr:gluconate 2-dehydrogenase subunit 3 family protein [Gammaproteobacteria bacterium]
MERRDLLKLIATATGVALVGARALAYNTVSPVPLSATKFSQKDVALFNEMAEVIIPQTDTPGAKAANVGQIMAILVADCYTSKLQKIFKDGITKIQTRSKLEFKKEFLLLTPTQRNTLFQALDSEAKAHNQGKHYHIATEKPSKWEPGTDEFTPHYFTLLKQLTLYGFFTSKEGANKVLRYVATPGRYDGALSYKKGDRAWAT